jgi:hypothetical protein
MEVKTLRSLRLCLPSEIRLCFYFTGARGDLNHVNPVRKNVCDRLRMSAVKKKYILMAILVLFSASSCLAAQITFSPRLTLSEEYTDNVFREPDIPELGLEPEEDFIFRVSARRHPWHRGPQGGPVHCL